MSDEQFKQRLAALMEERDRYKRLYERTLLNLMAYEPPVTEPCRVQRRCTVPVRMGLRFANAAQAEDCADAWEEHMKSKYGDSY